MSNLINFKKNYLDFYQDNLSGNLMRIFLPQNTIKFNTYYNLCFKTEFDNVISYKKRDNSGIMFDIALHGDMKKEERMFKLFDKEIRSDFQINFHSYLKKFESNFNFPFYMLVPRRDYIELDFSKPSKKNNLLEFLLSRLQKENLNIIKNSSNHKKYIISGFEDNKFEIFYNLHDKYSGIDGINFLDCSYAYGKEKADDIVEIINSYVLDKKSIFL